MSKLFHISDIHLSFKADGTVQKPMDQRRWSIGSPNYVGYLGKMSAYGIANIAPEDFVVVTGDLTHDMKHAHAIHSLRWFRYNVNGTLIFIKGNHDSYINFAALRLDTIGEKVFLIDEGEIISIGPYTFGCYSDHDNKSSDAKVNEYLDMAKAIAAQAKLRETIPVMVSHYPVSEDVAKSIGQLGVKIYLSGHVHCTAAGGNDWTWYDANAKPTNDKTFNGCYFSTGTTDVNFQLTGEYFKEIKAGNTGPMSTKSKNSLRAKAGAKFACHDRFIDTFDSEDPLNPGNSIAGFQCRSKGLMQGSLLITHVNGVEVDPQLVYGTPKLAYPYKEGTETYDEFPKAKYYYLSEKWNGVNILFYKYYDSNGEMFITAKTKGTAVAKDSEFGKFMTLTREALNWHDYKRSIMADLPPTLMPMMHDAYQSMSAELCGRKEPHLVKYDFDIALKPLFFTREDGSIEAYIDEKSSIMPRPFHYNYSDYVQSVCRSSQERDFERNEEYRKANNLPHKYEYEHFEVEGKVLYLLDDKYKVINRTLYKIKPKDIEEVHWQTFNASMQGRVREALDKLGQENLEICEENLKEELDMGPKEWDKFGRDVMAYATQNPGKDNRKVIILVGLPGSGKSTLAKQLESQGYVRVNQDELGSRNKCKELMESALKTNKPVVVDRCNFDLRQRKSWIDLAAKYGVKNVVAVCINTPVDVCKDRIITRGAHPTVEPVEGSKAIVDNFAKLMTEPKLEEGFAGIKTLDGTNPIDWRECEYP